MLLSPAKQQTFFSFVGIGCEQSQSEVNGLQGQSEEYYFGLVSGLQIAFDDMCFGSPTKDGQAHLDLITPALLLKYTYKTGKIEMVIGDSKKFIDITASTPSEVRMAIKLLLSNVMPDDHYEIPIEFLNSL